jgi:hypothetical protein
MLSFESYLKEDYAELSEKLITFAGKAYPKFGNVVIMAGGAGSGKGFVIDRLVGLEGYTFDVDQLKSLAAKTPAIIKKIKDEMGIDIADLAANLRNPENVAKLHDIIGSYLGLDAARQKTLYTSILTASPDRKPNIIFDVTLKDLKKLETLTRQVTGLGYDKKSVHIVWVINDIEVAKAQNAKRDRTVPVEILVNTHRGAAQTMLDIVNMGNSLKKYMDGDIVFAFNKIGVDANLATSDRGGSYIKGPHIKDANYFYVKRSGKPVMDVETINKDVRAKIAQYVPKNAEWI